MAQALGDDRSPQGQHRGAIDGNGEWYARFHRGRLCHPGQEFELGSCTPRSPNVSNSSAVLTNAMALKDTLMAERETNGGDKVATVEKTAQRIFGKRASFYTTSTVHADPSVLTRVVDLAAPQPQWTALDVATGTGHTALALAPHVASVIGIDLTPEMLSEAERLRAERDARNVAFRLGDVHHLPFEDASFDLVTCRRAAHHFSDIALALQEIRRVLRPGGRVVIDDRSVPEDNFLDRCVNQLDWYHDESHVREYRPSEWRRMLAACGLVVETVETYTLHRPLSALTDGVAPENVAKIHGILASLTDDQRMSLNFTDVDGQPHLNPSFLLFNITNPLERLDSCPAYRPKRSHVILIL